MENKNDIGKAFREKLDSLDKVPGNRVWDAIEADLDKKKKRRIIPFWFILSSVSVTTLLLFFVAGDLISGDQHAGPDAPMSIEKNTVGNGREEKTIQKTIPSGNTNDAITTEKGNAVNGSEESNQEQSLQDWDGGINWNPKEVRNLKGKKSKTSKDPKNRNAISGAKQNSKYGSISKKAGSGFSTASKKKSKKNIKPEIAGQTSSEKTMTSIPTDVIAIPETSDILADEEAIAAVGKDTLKKTTKKEIRQKKPSQDTTKTVEIEEELYKTFSIFLYARPTYYNIFDEKSSIDKTLDSNLVDSEIVFNYGGYLSFIYDEKWTVRAGIAKTVLKYTTQGIIINNGFEAPAAPPDFYGIDYAPGVSNLGIATQHQNATSMDIEQEFSYLEFPIELKYNLFKKAITIDGIGGFSTLFLTGNTVTAKLNNGEAVHMGSTREIYKAHVNANLGVGFNYKFLNHFQLNIEPMFKYHFRTGEVKQKPYSLGVQAGIEYMFNSKKKTKTAKK